MEHIDIVRIHETTKSYEANSHLEQGWILLSSGFCKGEVPGYDHHSYSLGLPKDVAASLDKEKNDPYDYSL